MENKTKENLVSSNFTWRIDDFSKLNNNWHYSDSFVVGGFRFRILICSKRGNKELIEQKEFVMYLVADASLNSTFAHFSLTVINQLENDKSITKADEREFKNTRRLWGFEFVPLTEFHDSSAGYLVNGVCIIEAKVTVYTPVVENRLICQQTENSESAGSVNEGIESSNLVDSAMQDQIASAVPEPPCDLHHVPSGSVVKKLLDRARRVKRLREDVDVLENEMKRRKTMVAAIAQGLDAAKQDLAKAEQDLIEIDMHAELGA